MPESKTRPCSARPTAVRPGRSCPGCAATTRAAAGSRAPAGCACTRFFLIPPTPSRIYIAISAAGAFRTDDGGKTWQPINRGLQVANTFPIPTPRSATASTASPCTRRGRSVLFMQKHWDVMRSDDAGDNWHEVSGNLPTDFGFPIDVHAHEPETIYVVPIKSDSEHYPPDGKLRVFRSRDGRERVGSAHQWPAAKRLLRQRATRRDVRRLARSVRYLLRHHGRTSLCLGRRRRYLGAHRPRSAAGAVRGSADTPMIRVVLPDTCELWRAWTAKWRSRVEGPATQRRSPGRAGGPLSDAARHYPRPRHAKRRPFLRFFACKEDLSHESPDAPLPDAVASGAEPFMVIGAIAGGYGP